MITITVAEEHKEVVANGGDPLRALCQTEVDLFDAYLKKHGDEYKKGLAKFERWVIEGYLYQKLRGRLDGAAPTDLPG